MTPGGPRPGRGTGRKRRRRVTGLPERPKETREKMRYSDPTSELDSDPLESTRPLVEMRNVYTVDPVG